MIAANSGGDHNVQTDLAAGLVFHGAVADKCSYAWRGLQFRVVPLGTGSCEACEQVSRQVCAGIGGTQDATLVGHRCRG